MSKSSARRKFILAILILVTLLGAIGFLKNSRIGGLVNDNTGLHFVEKCSPKILPENFNAFIGPKGWVHEFFNTDKPVAGAKVEVLGQTVFTNAKGEFKIPKHDPCLETLAVTITADGYDTEVATTITPEEAWAPTYFPSFLLKPFGYSQEQLNLEASTALPEGSAYFVSERDGKRSIYAINYDGSDRHAFFSSSLAGEQFSLEVSPNNKYLAYLSTEHASTNKLGQDIPELYIAGTSDSVGQLLSSAELIGTISWSPGGTFLAWTELADSKTILSIFDLQSKKITHFQSKDGDVFSFDYSNDDKQLVIAVQQIFSGSENLRVESSSIWLANGDGSNPTQIIPSQLYEQTEPLFLATNDIEFNNAGTKYIYSVKTKQISNTHTSIDTSMDQILSPDKTQIAYVATRDGQTNIIVSNPDGSSESQLSTDIYPYDLHWTQDNQHILYKGDSKLWIITTSTPTDQRSITQITE